MYPETDDTKHKNEQIEEFEEETVETDLPCARCGTDLKGLEVTGHCPECGLAIRLSMRDDLIRDSDPDWVRRVQRGCRLQHWAVMGVFYVAALGALAWFLDSRQIAPWGLVAAVAAALFALALIGFAWYGYQAVMALEPDPRGRATSRPAVAILQGLGYLVLAAAVALLAWAVVRGGAQMWLAATLGMLIGASGLFWVALARLQRLSRRIPDTTLSWSTIAFLAISVLFTAAALYVLFPPGQQAPPLPVDHEVVIAVGVMVPVVLSLWAVALFLTYARNLDQVLTGMQAQIARVQTA